MARNEAFDVVVVGGGAAGCVVAARLAEQASRSVLLLEAGPDRRSDLPDEMREGWTIRSDQFDWGYTSEPGAGGGVQNVRRTKLLGGTSWLTRFTPRGHPADVGRSAPVLHSIATFHSAGRSTEETPDLMFWLCDPIGTAGEPPFFDIDVVLLRPRSRGRVQLRSKDPGEAPSIELPALSASDIERLVEAYSRAVEVANRPEIRRLCDGPAPTVPPSGDLEAFVRTEAYSVPHVVGTCAMGLRPEVGAVVSPSGRVHGTERLSVVDASIMPDVPSGFTHIPTIMIAERLSDQLASLRV